MVAGINGDSIRLNAPLPQSLDARIARARIMTYDWPGRVRQVGIENLRCVSRHDAANPHDEQHAWDAIHIEAAANGWVRRVVAEHFAGSAVYLAEGCSHMTVTDCESVAPISEVAGYRRHTFYNAGQLNLFQRCRSEHGRHDFAVGYLAAGPNVFLDCEAVQALDFSGPIESWSTAVLYDNVNIDGGGLALSNRETEGQGAGWSSANSVLWQCNASLMTCRKPPTAQNWAIGCWSQFIGDGAWQTPNEFVRPDSLYRAQLAERLGAEAVANLNPTSIPDRPGDARTLESWSRRGMKTALQPRRSNRWRCATAGLPATARF